VRRLLLLLTLVACAQRKADPLPALPPVPDTGHATLSGLVRDGSNLPIAGVLVACNESNDTYVTGADGVYTLQVPASAAITVSTTKSGYASTVLTPMYLEPDRMVGGLNILMMPGPSISAFNAQATPDEQRGVLAIQVISLNGQCDAATGTVAVLNSVTQQPMPGALALYVNPGTTEPDRSVSAMQAGSYPNAYLVGVPEGQNAPIQFNKSGCPALELPVHYNGVQWMAGMRVWAKGLTQVPVFVQ
jgi:hypothetical protein